MGREQDPRGKVGWAAVQPIGMVIKPDGVQVEAMMVSSDKETAKRAVGEIERMTGGPVEVRDSKRGTFFGFSSRKWGGSNWDPPGPKPNWGKPPEDPRVN